MNRHRLIRSGFALFGATVLCAAGCSSGSLNPVRGRVLVNGQPAAGAMLVFLPEGADVTSIPATAVAGADGSFALATGDKTGARAGKYVVTVVWPDSSKKLTEQQIMMGANPRDGPDLLKGRYANARQSPLRAEVKSGDNQLEPFDLK